MDDSGLLERFVREHDAGAFRDIVFRHGPSVLRVCRSVLDDPHEAEDAFQTTFMVLVRKAASIQDPESLGGWLRGVARCTAVDARSRAARRRAVEKSWAQTVDREYLPEKETTELRQMVREELARLPETYRQPVMLCYLEGLTHQEAADQLGWPLGTVKARLSRARRLLHERLDRRKAGWGAALLLVLKGGGEASAAVPEPLLDSTVRAMTLAKAGGRKRATSPVGGAPVPTKAMPSLGTGHWAPRLWALLVILAAAITGVGVSAVVAAHAAPRHKEGKETLMNNVVDILTHACR